MRKGLERGSCVAEPAFLLLGMQGRQRASPSLLLWREISLSKDAYEQERNDQTKQDAATG
jgi:hypothetical protein